MGPRNGLSINLLSYCKVKHFMKTNSQLLIISLEVSRSPSLSGSVIITTIFWPVAVPQMPNPRPRPDRRQKTGECNVVHLVIRDETNR